MEGLRVSSFESVVVSGKTYRSNFDYQLKLEKDVDFEVGMEQIKQFYINSFDDIIKRSQDTKGKCVSLNLNGYVGRLPWDK